MAFFSPDQRDEISDFYYLRHGSTDLNEIRKGDGDNQEWFAQGARTNVGLNENGKRQALVAGSILRGFQIAKVVCSPLLRTIQTAHYAQVAGTFEIDDDLKEVDFGNYEGRMAPKEVFQPSEADLSRVSRALKKHANDPTTLFVSHGIVLKAVAKLLGVELLDEHRRNGRVLHFQRADKGWTVKAYESRVVLISGADHDIGRETAMKFISRGYRVSLGVQGISEPIDLFGVEDDFLHYAHFDARDPDSCATWIASAVAKFGRIDGLVEISNCGTDGRIEETGDDGANVDDTIADHFKATWRLASLCIPYLREAEGGRIGNIVPGAGHRFTESYNIGLSEMTRSHPLPAGVGTTAIYQGRVHSNLPTQPNDINVVLARTTAQIIYSVVEHANLAPHIVLEVTAHQACWATPPAA
ncbi:Agropine synthesis reductase [Agrobacterium tumefaciens str. Kerr 14]|uniref:Agropine synthesis reductase n=1 Tax=Agrobacterium tumefaciens str. Kerr 14 TaxID=1183424 RepID=A0A1S7SAU9_AGRTU|nr:SDR family NAD(P)-dependent oxidoreductase [Agrobacterium tumefaciens]CUX65574.1 Agropine synthesis reductase [Agrobacterium tumefaciens str. Kerr 14]